MKTARQIIQERIDSIGAEEKEEAIRLWAEEFFGDCCHESPFDPVSGHISPFALSGEEEIGIYYFVEFSDLGVAVFTGPSCGDNFVNDSLLLYADHSASEIIELLEEAFVDLCDRIPVIKKLPAVVVD